MRHRPINMRRYFGGNSSAGCGPSQAGKSYVAGPGCRRAFAALSRGVDQIEQGSRQIGASLKSNTVLVLCDLIGVDERTGREPKPSEREPQPIEEHRIAERRPWVSRGIEERIDEARAAVRARHRDDLNLNLTHSGRHADSRRERDRLAKLRRHHERLVGQAMHYDPKTPKGLTLTSCATPSSKLPMGSVCGAVPPTTTGCPEAAPVARASAWNSVFN